MKYFEFNIDKIQVEWIFSPVRSKKDIIDLLMRTIKLMLVDDKLNSELTHGKIVLYVSKMSRLFYCSTNKYFSINFPFTVIENDIGPLTFQTRHLNEIDNRTTSDVLSVMTSSDILNSSDIMEFAEPVYSISEYNDGFWSLLRDLLLFDDGYIRYDYDDEHENGLKHPLNHLDVFYSSRTTFKMGLNSRINDRHLMDLLDINTDCHFLNTV